VVVVVGGAVKVSLQGSSLGDLNQNLIHNVVGNIGGEHIKNKAVSTGQGQVVKSPCLYTSHQDGPGEVRYTDSGSSVDKSQDGEDGEGQPPQPQNKEVLLIEQIIGENAQVVGSVDTTCSSTNSDVAGDLSREQFTHRIMSQILSILTNMFHRPDIVHNFLSISPELVEKKSIGNNNTEKNSNQVQKLAEAEVHVVAGKSGAEVKEVAGDGGRVTVLDDVSEHVALKEVSPERPWHLGETKTEGQQEGQPQVVGGHGSILR